MEELEGETGEEEAAAARFMILTFGAGASSCSTKSLSRSAGLRV